MRRFGFALTLVAAIALIGVLAGCSCSPDQQASSSTASTPQAASSSSQPASSSSASAEITVPDVVHHDSDDARHRLVDAGLVVDEVKRDYSDEVPPNVVISQEPAAGSVVKKGDAATITVSLGRKAPEMVAMPNLIGLTQEDAEAKLKDAGLVPVPGKSEYSDTVEPGLVCEQYVQEGTQLARGSHVTFGISLGRGTVKMPNELGRSYEDAKDELMRLNLGVDKSESYSDEVEAGLVIDQTVAPGAEVAKGTTVNLEVSLGPKPVEKVAVPDIMTYSLEDAEEALESAGLEYSYSGDPDGSVNSVTPEPGTEVELGSTVKFTLQHESTLVAVPDVTGLTGPDARAAIEQVGLELDFDVRHPERVLIGTTPPAGTLLDVGTFVRAEYNEDPAPTEQVAVPDVKGMSAKKAAKQFEKLGIKLKYDKKQADAVLSGTKPKAGTMVDPGTEVEAQFKKEDKKQQSSSTTAAPDEGNNDDAAPDESESNDAAPDDVSNTSAAPDGDAADAGDASVSEESSSTEQDE